MVYVRFPLSLRNVEDLLNERGIDISYETVRFWWNRFDPLFAAEIRKNTVSQMRAYSNWQWHLDEVFVRINGETHYLWRAVDHEGEVLESFVTKRLDRKAALKLLLRTMKRHGRPHIFVTDKLLSYGAAMKVVGNVDKQETGRWLNNRAENSYQPFRRRERAMLRFRRMRTLQKFAAVHGSVHNHFNAERHLYSRSNFKLNRAAALTDWRGLCAASQIEVAGEQRLVRIGLTAPVLGLLQSCLRICPVGCRGCFAFRILWSGLLAASCRCVLYFEANTPEACFGVSKTEDVSCSPAASSLGIFHGAEAHAP